MLMYLIESVRLSSDNINSVAKVIKHLGGKFVSTEFAKNHINTKIHFIAQDSKNTIHALHLHWPIVCFLESIHQPCQML